jgi:hypothetical protein
MIAILPHDAPADEVAALAAQGVTVYSGVPARWRMEVPEVAEAIAAQVAAHGSVSLEVDPLQVVADAAWARTAAVIVDGETQRRAFAGYEWPAASGAFYSTSHLAQTSTTGLLGCIVLGIGEWPQSVSRTDGSVGWLQSEDEARAFVGAGFRAVRARLDYGRQLRHHILARAALPLDDERVVEIRAIAETYIAGGSPTLPDWSA